MAEHLGAAGEGNQPPSDDQMEEDTNQQDADSDLVKCPKCGFSFTPTVDEAGEEKEVQPEQVDPEILKELRAVMSTSYKYPVDDEGLKKCIMKTSTDPKKLLNFFKDVAALHENTDQGEGNQPPSEDQMEEDTTQQDADSESGESPESGFSGRDTVDQVEEAVEVQPERVRLQGDVDPEILKKLRAVMSESYKYLDDEVLKECIMKTSIDQKELLQFLTNFEALNKNTDQGQKPSGSRSKQKVKSSTSTSTAWIPPVYTVKVHSVSTGRTCGADDEILEKVKNMRWSTTQVKITDYQECDIIIAFCPITSRVGSDVEAAMRKIPGNKPVILVLMHHTRDVDFSTNIKKWSETFQNVVLDVHVLFHETRLGLLKCSRNDEAVHQIQKVLKAHSKYSLFS